jgi:hypothetical protein
MIGGTPGIFEEARRRLVGSAHPHHRDSAALSGRGRRERVNRGAANECHADAFALDDRRPARFGEISSPAAVRNARVIEQLDGTQQPFHPLVHARIVGHVHHLEAGPNIRWQHPLIRARPLAPMFLNQVLGIGDHGFQVAERDVRGAQVGTDIFKSRVRIGPLDVGIPDKNDFDIFFAHDLLLN